MKTLHCHFFHVCTVMFIKKSINMMLMLKELKRHAVPHVYSCKKRKEKKIYTIGLPFIITEARMSLLLETSDSSFSLPTKQHNLHSPAYVKICLFYVKCGSRIALVSKQIFFQYAVKLHGHPSFKDKYVMFINNITFKLPFFFFFFFFLLLPVAKGLTQHFQSTVGTFSLHAWLLH